MRRMVLVFSVPIATYDRDVPLEFGFTSEDEMCIIVGYYYISLDKNTSEE